MRTDLVCNRPATVYLAFPAEQPKPCCEYHRAIAVGFASVLCAVVVVSPIPADAGGVVPCTQPISDGWDER